MDNMEYENGKDDFNGIDESKNTDNFTDSVDMSQNLEVERWNSNYEQSYGCSNEKRKHINIQNVPLKKKWLRRIFPYMACMLISAILGGIAGGAFVSYTMDKYTYKSPFTSSQISGDGLNQTSYTPSTTLIGKIAENVGPAVVGITSKGIVSKDIFGSTQEGEGTGSGVIFDSNGLIVTNQHVIDGAKEIYVKLPGGDELKAKVLGSDSMSDIAVLQVNIKNLPAAKFGDSSTIRVGDLAIAIGNPFGEEYAGTVTSGIISAVNRRMNVSDGTYSRRYNLIQTDAAINPGNSGGALINQNGEVIGINTIKYVGEDVEGMGFAIPINDVKKIIDQLMTNGYVSRPMLNITVTTVTQEEAEEYNEPQGARVKAVQIGGAADKAGIKAEDIITEIEGVVVKTSDELIAQIEKYNVGDTISLNIWRNGEYLTISVTLGDSNTFTN